MTIEYITKDLTTVNHGIVAHGCNCQGKMGAGVALAIRKKWPVVYFEYVDMVASVGRNRASLLGRCQIIETEHAEFSRVYVANCFTQEYYGREAGKRYADPAAISQSLNYVLRVCKNNDLPLYMSKIGCSLGGLHWDSDVAPMLMNFDSAFNNELSIFVCEL